MQYDTKYVIKLTGNTPKFNVFFGPLLVDRRKYTYDPIVFTSSPL